MNKTTLSLALTTLVSLAPLGHAHGVHGFAPAAGLSGEFRAEPRMAAPMRQPVRVGARLGTVSRNWDRRHVYYWSGHCYRFVGGDWVLFDVGLYPFDASYIYSYDTGDGIPVYTGPVERGLPRSPVVANVQAALVKTGYYNGPVDGRYGPSTQRAIARYQRAHRMAATGTIGRPLLQSLRIS